MTNSLIFRNGHQAVSMNSREIADLVEKRHDSVKRTIETLINQGIVTQPQFVDESYKDGSGRTVVTKCYLFTGEQGKRDSIIVVAQLSPEFTARLVDRWQELEAQLVQSPTYLTKYENEHAAAQLVSAYVEAAKAFGFEGNQAVLSADRAVRNITGISPLTLMEHTVLIAPDQEQLLTPSDIGLLINSKPRSVNPLLIKHGLQTAHRDHKDRIYYELTDLGHTYGIYLDTGKKHSDGTPIRQIKWKSSGIEFLQQKINAEKLH